MKRVRFLQCGSSVLRVIVIIPAAMFVAGIGWYSYAEHRRHYWDDKVRELCAKDGGLHIFEQVSLPLSAYQTLLNVFGELSPPELGGGRNEAPVGRVSLNTHLHIGVPEVVRYEQRLVRRIDAKVLGSYITYARIGGDSGFVDNPSTFACPQSAQNWFARIILKQGE